MCVLLSYPNNYPSCHPNNYHPNYHPSSYIIPVNGHFRNLNWRYLPYIYKAYVLGLFFRPIF